MASDNMNSDNECYFKEQHTSWNISSPQELKRQRDIKQALIDKLCLKADIVISKYSKKKRNLKVCIGCISFIDTSTYQEQFESFAKKMKADHVKQTPPVLQTVEDHAQANEPPTLVSIQPVQYSDTAIKDSQSQSMDANEKPSESTTSLTFTNEHKNVPTFSDSELETEADASMFPNAADFDKEGETLTGDACSDRKSTSNIETSMFSEDEDLDAMVNQLSQMQKAALVNSIARSERRHLMNDAEQNSKTFKVADGLQYLDMQTYYERQNHVLKAFLNGVQSECENHASALNLYSHSKAIEAILHIAEPQYLPPLHFRESLVLYNTTKSKTALEMLAKKSPYPSYQSVKGWLNDLSLNPKVQRPIGDITIAIDNNQILKKKWAIRVETKSCINVVTMVVAFEFDGSGRLQFDSHLAPITWRQLQVLEEDIQQLKNIGKDPATRDLQMSHLSPYVTRRLYKVLQEQQFVDDAWTDLVDLRVRQDEKDQTVKVCSQCQHENKISSRKCVCGLSLPNKQAQKTVPQNVQRKVRETRVQYDEARVATAHADDVQAEHSLLGCINKDDIPKTYVLRPCNVNPNSYESIRTCLQDVGKQAGIKRYGHGDRCFVFIYSDCVPYNLIQRVIWCTYRCTCGELLTSLLKRNDHLIQNNDHQCFIEFDWVLSFPGGGHIEMNMLKALVELLWPICWKEMVSLFHFTSVAALRSAQHVSDHHKGWTLLQIFRNALVDELVLPYIREELSKDTDKVELSSRSYLKFLDKQKNPNYIFMADVAFELVDAICMFRAGIRTGRVDVIMAGRAIFAKMWVGRRHPQYRELEVKDMIQRLQMPDKLRELVDKSMSLNMTGVACTAEGPDFRLEEVNRNVQAFMPLAPKQTDWEKVCVNFDTLKDIRLNLFKDKQIQDHTRSPSKPPNQAAEELAVRAMFRKVDYLNCPQTTAEHVSVTGEKLNPDLVKFVALAETSFSTFVDATIKYREEVAAIKPAAVECKSIQPVLVTASEVEEFDKLERKTNSQLEMMTEEEISNIVDDGLRQEWKELWETAVKRKSNKKTYIDFLEEVKAFNLDVDSDCDACVESADNDE